MNSSLEEPTTLTADDPRAADLAEFDLALRTRDASSASRISGELIDGGRTDEVLNVAAVHAAGNTTALNLLVETLDASGTVQRFVGSMLLDISAVEDVSQDSLISIVESIGSYRGGGKFTTWVHTIVQRRVADHLRRQRDSAPLHDEDAPAARMSSVIATRATVHRSLAELPELYRVPVILRDIRGQPYSEISEELGRSVGTVKSQVSRGRAMVAGMLQAPGRSDGR